MCGKSYKKAVGIVLACSLMLSNVFAAGAEAKSPISSICKDGEWNVLKIVNKERESIGLVPLSMTKGLQDAVHIRAEELVRKFSHTRPGGKDCFTVLDEVGSDIFNAVGENIAAGYMFPETVMNGWMNSPGHRANILSGAYTHIGVGYTYNGSAQYKYYWTQMFGGACAPQSISVKNGSTVKSYQKGTSIEDMDRVLVVKCQHGKGYIPLDSSMCPRYKKNAAGTQTVKVSFGGKSASFKVRIGGTSIKKAKVTNVKKKVYNGKAQKQNPKVVLNGKKLVKGKDYALSYKNNKKVGTATLIITGKGKYSGTIKKTFKIVRKK